MEVVPPVLVIIAFADVVRAAIGYCRAAMTTTAVDIDLQKQNEWQFHKHSITCRLLLLQSHLYDFVVVLFDLVVDLVFDLVVDLGDLVVGFSC